MARSYVNDSDEVFRTVIYDPSGKKIVFGPYGTEHQARSQATRNTNGVWTSLNNAIWEVQKASITWTKVSGNG